MQRRTYTKNLTKKEELPKNGIFVFGSNTEGRHGKGTALTAKTHFGAKYGQASGLQGKSYGLVTTDLVLKAKGERYPEADIKEHIMDLYDEASNNPQYDFYIPYAAGAINLNGYDSAHLADMFASTALCNIDDIPNNIIFKESFWNLMVEWEQKRNAYISVIYKKNVASDGGKYLARLMINETKKPIIYQDESIAEVKAYLAIFYPEYQIKGIRDE